MTPPTGHHDGGGRLAPPSDRFMVPVQRRTSTPSRWLSPETSRVLLRGMLLLGAAAVAAGVVVMGGVVVQRSDAMPLRSVVITAANGQTLSSGERAEITHYLDVDDEERLYGLDLAELVLRAQEHPFVKTATARRLPPDTVEIAVTLRTPVAVVALEHNYVVDDEGTLFKALSVDDGLDLPVITGLVEGLLAADAPGQKDLQQAAALAFDVMQSQRLTGRVSEVHVDAPGLLSLVLSDGARVHLGQRHAVVGYAGALRRLDEVISRLDATSQVAAVIHLDDVKRPERAFVRLRPAFESALVGGGNNPRERATTGSRELPREDDGHGTKKGSST